MLQNKKDQQNRQLQAMLLLARERLRRYSPEQLCEKAEILFDAAAREFCLKSLGKEIRISYPEFEIQDELDMWHHLTLLQYMDTADGTPLSGKTISLTEMRGGMARGAGFNKDIELMMSRYFSGVGGREFTEACTALGAEILPSRADVTAVFSYAPRFPITLNFWESDEEFPSSGKVLVDENAEHYLTIEAAGGACSAVVQALAEQIRKSKNSC
ncbi:MAG: DUF3786 domain-containing protein [Blautia sp.]|nr:DUF3786 domain-containing protein [Blautia sp.]